jgi:hypothetical protein
MHDRPARAPCFAVRGSISLVALAVALLSFHVEAQEAEKSPPPRQIALTVAQNVPPGFEDIDETVETVFDIYFAGRLVGTAPVRVANGQATFLNPDVVASMLPSRIDRQKVIALLSSPLPTNERLRCLPGRTADCGTLPPDQAGVIVNPERFSLDLFLTSDFFLEPSEDDLYLSDPISGPSLIQTALVSFSGGENGGGNLNFGATLDTLASIGRTSFVAQTLLRDDGSNLQRAYFQHFWQKRSAAAGFLQQNSSISFNTYRMVGAEYGSFFGARRDLADGLQTPLEIILPRAAQVEVYRDDVLIHAARLEGGLQQISTSNFPSGSYQVHIIARDGDQILLDENRLYTKTTDLPPEGEWAYRIRAGVRVSDFDVFTPLPGSTLGSRRPFFPHVTNEPLVSLSATRRVTPGIGLGGEILAVDDSVYAEGSAIAYLGNVKGVAAAALGTDGAYSFQLNSIAQIGRFNISLIGRHARLKDDFIGPQDDEFRPFFRSEDTVQGGVSFDIGSGNLSFSGSYTSTPGFRDRYILSARYSRSLNIGSMGLARLAAYAQKANDDLRVGLTVTFLKRLDRKTVLTYGGGGEYRSKSDVAPKREGAYPVANVQLSRQDRLGTVDLTSQAGISTDSERNRAYVSSTAVSNYGALDITADYENRRGSNSPGEFGVSGNLFSGIVIGGGKVRFGIRQPGGDAALLIDVERPESDRETDLRDEGRYRILLGNQFIGSVAPGKAATLVAQSFRDYRVGLQPEGSPPYSVDLSTRRVPLYPGNVALVKYTMTRVVAIFGRLLDQAGQPIGGARVSGKGDTTATDDNGYFVYSASSDDRIELFDKSDKVCHTIAMGEVLKAMPSGGHQDYLKIGDIRCDVAVPIPASPVPVAAAPVAPVPADAADDGESKPQAEADIDLRLNGEAKHALAMAEPRGYPVNLLPDGFDPAPVAEADVRLDLTALLNARGPLLTGNSADAVMKSFRRLERICRDSGMNCPDEPTGSMRG